MIIHARIDGQEAALITGDCQIVVFARDKNAHNFRVLHSMSTHGLNSKFIGLDPHANTQYAPVVYLKSTDGIERHNFDTLVQWFSNCASRRPGASFQFSKGVAEYFGFVPLS